MWQDLRWLESDITELSLVHLVISFLALLYTFSLVIIVFHSDYVQSFHLFFWNMYAFLNPPVGQGGGWGIKNSLNYGSGQIRIRCVLFADCIDDLICKQLTHDYQFCEYIIHHVMLQYWNHGFKSESWWWMPVAIGVM